MAARVLVFLVSLGVRALRALCRSKADLVIENLALRQQVATLVKERPRPAIDDAERAFWVAFRASWAGWASRLFIVQANTVARWHRERFRRHWARISRENRRPGRPRIDVELRQLIRDMAGNRDAIFNPAVVLNKDTPNKRPVTPRPSATATVVALPRVGGLHHRYEWRKAA